MNETATPYFNRLRGRSRVHPPVDPWVQTAAHDFLIQLAGSEAESAVLGSPPAAITLRKGEGFRALARGPMARGDDDPIAVFAGPFEVDWMPEEAPGPP